MKTLFILLFLCVTHDAISANNNTQTIEDLTNNNEVQSRVETDRIYPKSSKVLVHKNLYILNTGFEHLPFNGYFKVNKFSPHMSFYTVFPNKVEVKSHSYFGAMDHMPMTEKSLRKYNENLSRCKRSLTSDMINVNNTNSTVVASANINQNVETNNIAVTSVIKKQIVDIKVGNNDETTNMKVNLGKGAKLVKEDDKGMNDKNVKISKELKLHENQTQMTKTDNIQMGSMRKQANNILNNKITTYMVKKYNDAKNENTKNAFFNNLNVSVYRSNIDSIDLIHMTKNTKQKKLEGNEKIVIHDLKTLKVNRRDNKKIKEKSNKVKNYPKKSTLKLTKTKYDKKRKGITGNKNKNLKTLNSSKNNKLKTNKYDNKNKTKSLQKFDIRIKRSASSITIQDETNTEHKESVINNDAKQVIDQVMERLKEVVVNEARKLDTIELVEQNDVENAARKLETIELLERIDDANEGRKLETIELLERIDDENEARKLETIELLELIDIKSTSSENDVISKTNLRRTVSSKDANIEDYPYTVSIQKGGEHWCGGALLNPSLVITTANCVWKSNGLSKMQVRCGSRYTHKGGQEARIQEVIKHPQWSIHAEPDHDIALVLLDRNIRFGDTVHGVDLPNKLMYPVHKDLWVTSWGATRPKIPMGTGTMRIKPQGTAIGRDGIYTDRDNALQVLNMDVMDRDKCYNITRKYHVNLTENFICLAQDGNRGPCTRDTGAPAVNDGVLWGLASWSIRKLCGSRRVPAVFTYVASRSNMQFISNATLELMSDIKRSPFLGTGY